MAKNQIKFKLLLCTRPSVVGNEASALSPVPSNIDHPSLRRLGLPATSHGPLLSLYTVAAVTPTVLLSTTPALAVQQRCIKSAATITSCTLNLHVSVLKLNPQHWLFKCIAQLPEATCALCLHNPTLWDGALSPTVIT